MPLKSGSSRATISHNIATEINAGHDPKQAAAIAYSTARGDADPAAPIRAAGVMFITAAGEILFLKRGAGGDHPGEWCFPGGLAEDGETAQDTAERETAEEIGFLPEGHRSVWSRRIAAQETAAPALLPPPPPGEAIVMPVRSVDFTTFIQRAPERFDPVVSGEHTGFAWAQADTPPEPLHPGCRIALAKLTMDELGIARAIAAGDLTSPQRVANVSLFAIRITGTGAAYRRAKKEYVWREPAIYLNDEFLARCNGLPVIYEHPEKSLLNSKEFADRIIGTILLPYIQGDEVWGIAKIYDADSIALMTERQLSTSPGVVLRGGDEDSQVTLDNGETLLIEGKPYLLDHVAICERGVWDKGGEPSGVVSETDGVLSMTEEEKKAEEERLAKEKADAEAKMKADAESGDKLDKLLKLADSMSSCMDSFGKRLDAIEATRKDAETDPAMLAADRARKDADEKEAKERAGAEEMERKTKADADLVRTIEDIKARLPKELTDADYAAMADAQARADSTYQALGNTAPRPMQGETPMAYRKRLAHGLKGHSAKWKDTDIFSLPENVFINVEGDIRADAETAARTPATVAPGELRPIVRRTHAGHTITEYVGNPDAWMNQFAGPVRQYATKFNVNLGGSAS